MAFRTLDDLDVAGKRVLLRADLNVPVRDGKITDLTRIERLTPTIRELVGQGRQGHRLQPFRPAEGQARAGDVAGADGRRAGRGARPARALRRGLRRRRRPSRRSTAWRAATCWCWRTPASTPGRRRTIPAFAAALAKLADIYVNDAFSAAHRAHASTEGVAHLLPAYAGRLMQAELEALDAALGNPVRPVAAIVGGAKVSTKLDLLGNLVAKVNVLVIGGAMANTFLAAQGHRGRQVAAGSRDARDRARDPGAGEGGGLRGPAADRRRGGRRAQARRGDADRGGRRGAGRRDDPGCRPGDGGRADRAICRRWRTLVWNGPLGAFETPPFDAATTAFAKAVAEATGQGALRSVAGGGDTVSALRHAGVLDRMSYVSTAGGAFLEWLEGKTLPGVAALG